MDMLKLITTHPHAVEAIITRSRPAPMGHETVDNIECVVHFAANGGVDHIDARLAVRELFNTRGKKWSIGMGKRDVCLTAEETSNLLNLAGAAR